MKNIKRTRAGHSRTFKKLKTYPRHIKKDKSNNTRNEGKEIQTDTAENKCMAKEYYEKLYTKQIGQMRVYVNLPNKHIISQNRIRRK